MEEIIRKPKQKRNRKRKKRLDIRKIVIMLIATILLILFIKTIIPNKTQKVSVDEDNVGVIITNPDEKVEPKIKKEITDWNLRLANYNNILPEDFEVELANIDDNRQFDARAIKYLKEMMNDMRKDGITNIWVQSAYRSIKAQKKLYDNSIKKYLDQGKTQEEAEKLTLEYINKPGSSDHNLGLAVDFNYVDNKFEDLEGFKWLQENAENYGFILRYPKNKEDITKIAYESWHWRYVGKEHAQKMNELNMCLEEYVEYLSEL